MKQENKPIRWNVFIPCFIVIGGAALLGIVNNAWLTNVTYTMFDWSLSNFGWLYQIVAMVTLLLACLLLFTKVGKIRFGGPEAKAKHSFGSWFAMTLTGGIATGLITYGVNEVLIYYGNIYGELDGYGIAPLTQEAELFSMGRCFYNWTFIPYAMYALSLRCIPQLHGAARKTLEDAKKTIEIEMNSCCDNPIIWPEKGNEDVISACNADSAYVGMEMDSACIAAVGLAKMSERRNNRIVDGSLSGYPYFCIKDPGLNSGLMIPQYVQAGLLNEMRMLATPSTIDNTLTCGNQEDFIHSGGLIRVAENVTGALS